MTKRLDFILFSFLAILLVIAPLFRGGLDVRALLFLELVSLLLLVVILWEKLYWRFLTKLEFLLVLFILLVPLLYLLPLPYSIWSSLPGRELYNSVKEWSGLLDHSSISYNTLSLIPSETEQSFLVLLLPLSVFIATKSLTFSSLKKLLTLFLWVAAFEAILALLQYPHNLESIYHLGMKFGGNVGHGTYLNRDHFAALMEMSFPFALALLFYNYGSSIKHGKESFFNLTALFLSLSLLLLIGGIFSKSRAGSILLLLGIIISVFIYARHIGGRRTVGFSLLFGSISLGVGVTIGLIPVINRFIGRDPMEDGRKEIFENTMIAIHKFWPFGAGPGTFPDVYRNFQPIDQFGFIVRAHNDYLELLFNVGIFAVIGFLLYALLYLFQLKILYSSNWNGNKFIQVAAGIGIFVFLLHSLADFNLHTPANAIYFAFLNGLFFSTNNTNKFRKL